MNNIAEALKTAGVPLPPQNRRIWQWLKDNGPHTRADVASELKIKPETCQAAISVMLKAKILKRIERTTHKGGRLNNAYEALGTHFERPVKSGPVKPPASIVPLAVVSGFDAEKALGEYKLNELRAIYQYLHKHFRG